MSDMLAHLAKLAPFVAYDFTEFGETETVKLSRIQQLTGAHLGRNWVAVPHVTHHDEVDVTDAEVARGEWNAAHPDRRLTPVILLVRALARVLAEFPTFNASLSADGASLILKKYVNIGVAVDTPKGLVVPVLRDAATRSMTDLATDLATLAEKARTRGLSMAEMSGGSMTVSSLGHIGGTAFTPLINVPEVAILGATAIQQRAVPGTDGDIVWRRMLPLSLSYDHRVINGADAARFVRAIGTALQRPDLIA
ncbi:dihydrolipoamide acetyltransferase [Sphingomonas ginsenosidivorax]|uniref:Dihydrolipoyllysine-residue acetyltransferase component of pyruvate dehydrogenase complex n=1 Tax=Sphingomonas ginsenosidivorax TaxID=862135 RepID=A0A5C6UCC2_9SPHN|nr:2-oxo acid dehydrogenase subunit E2 [Sphingomonas ginsenosidivorax]TXC70304.1 dihydrolipoamide acetyltransferase [Sphingomonas ginsenosidivorax]